MVDYTFMLWSRHIVDMAYLIRDSGTVVVARVYGTSDRDTAIKAVSFMTSELTKPKAERVSGDYTVIAGFVHNQTKLTDENIKKGFDQVLHLEQEWQKGLSWFQDPIQCTTKEVGEA